MTAVSDQEDFRQRRSLSPVPGRRASALPHLHVSVLLLSAQWAGLHPRLWASCRETVQPQLREQSTVSVAGKRSGRSPIHSFIQKQPWLHPFTLLLALFSTQSWSTASSQSTSRANVCRSASTLRAPPSRPSSGSASNSFFYCVFCSGCRFVTVRPQRWSLHPCPPRSASHFSSVTEGCFFFPSAGQQRGIHPRFPRRRKDEG